jgi:ribonuclease VapC
MVIDTSSVVAIFLNEPERDRFLELIMAAEKCLISAATVVEIGIVLESRRSHAIMREFDLFLHEANIEVISVDQTQAEQALLSYRRYGKGRHPAALNFGDCFTHALAVVSGEPILAKSDEFRRANLEVLS